MDCPSFQCDFAQFEFPLAQSENDEVPSMAFRQGSKAGSGPTPPFVDWERDTASPAASAGTANKVTAGITTPMSMTTAAIAWKSRREDHEHEKTRRDTPNPLTSASPARLTETSREMQNHYGA